MLELFTLRGKSVQVSLDREFKWESENPNFKNVNRTYQIPEIITCWLCPKGDIMCFCPSTEDIVCSHWDSSTNAKGLSIEVCERRAKMKWISKIYTLKHSSEEILTKWHFRIRETIQEIKNRPKGLAIIINPVSGKAKTQSIYRKKVCPLFNRAGIITNVYHTEEKGHGINLIQDLSNKGILRSCDGIVAIGGDGIVSEVALGLIIAATKEAGVDPHDNESDLESTKIRLGIIPGGSTDAICHATHGASDPLTACLHIIMGDSRNVDVGALHANGKLQRVVMSQISYGYLGDILASSEQLRSLGPSRYVVCGVKQFFKNKSYAVKVRVKGSQLKSSASCNSVCTICTADGDYYTELNPSWEEITGNYSIVTTAVTSCACKYSPKGVSPTAHLGDGYSDLILVTGSSRLKLLSYLYTAITTGNIEKLSHVKITRANEINLQVENDSSIFNCDGEELRTKDLNIRIHRQKLRLFCRGIEDPFPIQSGYLRNWYS